MKLRSTQVLIDTKALRDNLLLLKTWTGDNFFCPMVKANGYGHGDLAAASIAEQLGIQNLGVALIEEGIRLRQHGVRANILVFTPFDAHGAEALWEYHLTPVVGSFPDLEALSVLEADQPLKVHLKFNTGMQRMGFDEHELPRVRERLATLPNVQVVGLCSHLTHGEEILDSDGPSQKQTAQFQAMTKEFTGIKHLHKSASLAKLKDKIAAGKMGARPGISVYGLPFDQEPLVEGLKPVLSWHTQLSSVHDVDAGRGVGYSARWVAPRRSIIGVVPVGYADGYFRALSNKGQMLFRGRRVPVVGSVCMDYTFLDLTAACGEGHAQVGENVVVLGPQAKEEIRAAEVAGQVGTIAYEVVTAISHRVPRKQV